MESLVADLRSDLRGIGAGLRRSAAVEWQRVRWKAFDAYFGIGFHLCLLGLGLVASVSAALLIVHGIHGALVGWSGTAWIGDLGAGAVVLTLLTGGRLVVRARLRNDCVRRAKQALAEAGPAGDGRP